jgi:hypothetical protein
MLANNYSIHLLNIQNILIAHDVKRCWLFSILKTICILSTLTFSSEHALKINNNSSTSTETSSPPTSIVEIKYDKNTMMIWGKETETMLEMCRVSFSRTLYPDPILHISRLRAVNQYSQQVLNLIIVSRKIEPTVRKRMIRRLSH